VRREEDVAEHEVPVRALADRIRCKEGIRYPLQCRLNVEARVASFAISLPIQRSGVKIITIVLVRKLRSHHAIADAPARRERVPVGAREPAQRGGRRRAGVRESVFEMSGDGTRGACGSDSRNVKNEVDADVDAMDWAANATDVLRPQRKIVPGDGGVRVPVGTDGSGCVGAGFTAGRAAAGAWNALGLKSASDEAKPVKPSAVWDERKESNVSAEHAVGGAPDDGRGR
jgi:hypothetical protein